MFLIGRTFSRQHPFPLNGERPAIASNIPSEVPATAVETLKYEATGTINNYVLGDGEQGWYKVVIASGNNAGGTGSYYGGGRVATVKCYFCPNTRLNFWAPISGSTYRGPDYNNGLLTAAYGASGTPSTVVSGAQGGAGAGMTSTGTNGGGGAGFVASIAFNSETEYRCGMPVVKKTRTGYTQCPSFVYLDANNEPITLTTAPSLDSDLGYAYTGYIPDPSSLTGGTIEVIGFLTDEPIPYVGQEVKVYYMDDQTVPFYTTTIVEAPKETVYCQTCHGNLVIQGNSVYNTAGARVGYIAGVTQNFRNRTVIVVQYSGRQESYMLDPSATASYQRQVYYGWEISATDITTTHTRTFWTNKEDATNVGVNGVFAYEKVNGVMCISSVNAENFYFAQRRPDLDTVSDRVAFGVTSDHSTRIWGTNQGSAMSYSHVGTGAYFWLLAGGGGYWDGNSTNYCGGAAFGSILYAVNSKQQTGGFDYGCAVGPADSFGSTGGKDPGIVVVDCNDAIAYDTVDASNAGWGNFFGLNSSSVGYVRVYKLSDSTDVTKYAQRIYYPASEQDYTAALTVNDVLVDTITIERSIYQTERFLQDVKQGDVLKIRLTGDGGSTENYIYTITSETLAFGLVLGAEPWKVREYTETGDHVLGMSPGSYAAVLVSGGGAGGSPSIAGGTHSVNYGGRGGSSVPRVVRFTNNDTQVATIKVGKGATSDAGAGAGGTSYDAGGSRPGISGGGAGQPTMVTFEKDVTVESMPIRLYSFTNGSTVYYTQNSYPDTNGMLTRFCDENGELNGLTAYKSYNGTTYGLTCQQDGNFYTNVSQTGNPNIDIDYSGLTKCIFNVSPGGGGGAGGASKSHRYGSGGGGGGGGGWYRIDMYNRYYYAVPGAAGGGAIAQAQAGHGGSGNRLDGYSITAFRGQNGTSSTGGNGGTGYGSGGGAGGRGNANSGSAFCGAGGGGAPGNELGGWGGYNNGSSYNDAMAKTEMLWGKPTEYGKGGNGYYGNSQPVSWYSGNDGYAFLYRFETITQTINCGGVQDTVDEVIDCGSLLDTDITETIDCDII